MAGPPATGRSRPTDGFDDKSLFVQLPDDAAYGYTSRVAQYGHDDGLAIRGCFVYRGSSIPALVGRYLFGDIVNGRIFSVPVSGLRQVSLATIREVTILRDGVTVMLRGPLGTTGRTDLRFSQDLAGEVYRLSKQDGIIRKLGPAKVHRC